MDDEDPADIAASMGLDIGSRKGVYRPSDVSPTAMVTAVMNGEGFGRPRTAGAVYVVIGVIGVIINLAALAQGRVFLWLLPVTPIFLVPGAWLLLFGQPEAVPRGDKVPMWSRIGLGVFLVMGALSGFGALLAAIFGH